MLITPQRLLCLLLFLFSSFNSIAQMKWRLSAKIVEEMQPATSKYKTTDSTHYYYSFQHNRGSDTLGKTIDYDHSNLYYLANETDTHLSYTTKSIKTYDNNNHQLTQCTIRTFNGASDTMATDTFSYNNDLRINAKSYGKKASPNKEWIKKSEERYAYNAKKQWTYTDAYSYDYPSNQVVNVTKRFVSYDGNDRLKKDSSRAFKNNVWKDNSILNYTYDPSGKLVYINDARPVLGNTLHHYYFYNNKGYKIKDSICDFDWPATYAKTTYSYYANGQLATDTSFSVNNIIYATVYTYTPFGYISSETSLSPSFTPTQRIRYIYENYWATGVQEATINNDKLSLYPLPASDVLTIEWQPENPCSLQGRIIDMQGRELKSWTDEANGLYRKDINTSNLPSGLYYINISADGTTLNKKFIIAR